MTIEEYKRGHAALLSLAAEGPDVLRLRGADEDAARQYGIPQTAPGKSVKQLQAALCALGEDVQVTGCFGDKTETALRRLIGAPDFNATRGDVQTLSGLFLDKILATRPPMTDQGHDSGVDTQVSKQTGGTGETPLPLVYPPHFCQADDDWAGRTLGKPRVVKPDPSRPPPPLTPEEKASGLRSMQSDGCGIACCSMLAAHLVPTEPILPAPRPPQPEDPRIHLDAFLDANEGYMRKADGTITNMLMWGKVAEFIAQYGVQVEYKRETSFPDPGYADGDDTQEGRLRNDQRAALDRACDLIEQGVFPILRVKFNKDYCERPFSHFVLGLRYDGHNLYFHDPGTAQGDGTQDSLDNTMLTQRKGGYRIVGLDYFVRKEAVV